MLKRLEDVPQFTLAEGSPDVRGWEVVDRGHHTLGKVASLIIDDNTEDTEGLTPIRYLGIQADGSVRMVPIGMTEINDARHEVVLTRAEDTDLDRLPEFHGEGTVDRDRGFFSRFFPNEREVNYRRPEFEHKSDTLHLIEERLHIGKREKQVGEAVARKRTEMRPEEETVQLRKESVEVERRPVNKPLSETDFAQTGGRALETEREIRMPIMGEEAVVEKKPYVKEEVTLRKNVGTESKTVREQVRSEELEFAGTEPEGRLERNEEFVGTEPAGRLQRDEEFVSTEPENRLATNEVGEAEPRKEGLGDKIKRSLNMD